MTYDVWAKRRFLLILVALLLARPARAQEEKRIETEIRLNAIAYGNFFQVPDGADKENVQAAEAQARLTYGLGENLSTKVFGYLSLTSYRQFNSSPRFAGGVMHDSRPHAVEVSAELELNQPQVDVGDGLDTADTISLVGAYSYRLTQDWEASAAFQFRDQSFDLRPRNDNHMYSAGPALRYRGFGYKFSPEVGASWGDRNAVDNNEDLSERDIFLTLRFIPTPPLYISTRLRQRHRGFSVQEEDRSNFGRMDDRLQWTVMASYQFTQHLAANLYYAYTDADSTRPSRVFTTNLLSVGVAYGF